MENNYSRTFWQSPLSSNLHFQGVEEINPISNRMLQETKRNCYTAYTKMHGSRGPRSVAPTCPYLFQPQQKTFPLSAKPQWTPLHFSEHQQKVNSTISGPLKYALKYELSIIDSRNATNGISRFDMKLRQISHPPFLNTDSLNWQATQNSQPVKMAVCLAPQDTDMALSFSSTGASTRVGSICRNSVLSYKHDNNKKNFDLEAKFSDPLEIWLASISIVQLWAVALLWDKTKT